MTLKTRLVLLLSLLLLTTASCSSDEKAEKAKLNQQYKAEFEALADEKKQLALELQQKIKLQAAGKKNVNVEDIVPANDEDLVALKEVQKRQTEILQQLVKNSPGDSQMRFNLALMQFEQNDSQSGLNILQQISPLETPGHAGGHLLLAKYFVSRSARASKEAFKVSVDENGLQADPTNTKVETVANIDKALAHLEHCLKVDQGNLEALKVKATLLNAKGEFAAAYEPLEQLFEVDPKLYPALCKINARLGRSEQNGAVIDSAIARFDELLNRTESPLSDQQRLLVWQELSKCYVLKKDFATIESRLLETFGQGLQEGKSERENQIQLAGQRLLSGIYANWAKEFSLTTENSAKDRLELLRRGYQWGKKNPGILRELTALAAHEDESIAREALTIYDGKNDISAPASVLAQLGSQELLRENYNSGITYLERARAVQPLNPEILNNLAFAYLKGDSANAERALRLADEAIRLAKGKPGFAKFQTFFQDTRGLALVELKRYQDAIAAFEIALKARPENRKILEALVNCCNQLGVPATTWESKLQQLQDGLPAGSGN